MTLSSISFETKPDTLELLATILEYDDQVFWIRDWERQRYLYVSPAYEKIWGRTCQSLYERPESLYESIPAEDRPHFLAQLKDLKKDRPLSLEHRVVRPDATVRWVRARLFPVKDAQSKLYRVVGIATDVTDRKLAEKAMVEASARERARIGQDLHDGLGQHLMGTLMVSKVLQQKLAAEGHAEAEAAGQVSQLIAESITQSRALARSLYPAELSNVGLEHALRQLSTNVAQTSNISCAFECTPGIVIDDPEIATHLYRIAQEAISNAVSHAKADHLDLSLTEADGLLTLSIQDNGLGIQEPSTAQDGIGLKIMRYRAGLIGASISIRKNPTGDARSMSTVMSPSKRVFIVDDHPIVRRGLRQLVDFERGLQTCGEAPDAARALEAIESCKPDLVLVDISLEGSSGLELIKNLRLRWKDLLILTVSMHDESLYAERALRAGAQGYVKKEEDVGKILVAIHAVLNGRYDFNESLAGSLPPKGHTMRLKSKLSVDHLSDRELEVFEHIGKGFSTRQIADRLLVSVKTIESYRSQIKLKLNISTAIQLTLRAFQWVEHENGEDGRGA